jgi:hypothetical protein
MVHAGSGPARLTKSKRDLRGCNCGFRLKPEATRMRGGNCSFRLKPEEATGLEACLVPNTTGWEVDELAHEVLDERPFRERFGERHGPLDGQRCPEIVWAVETGGLYKAEPDGISIDFHALDDQSDTGIVASQHQGFQLPIGANIKPVSLVFRIHGVENLLRIPLDHIVAALPAVALEI